MWLFNSSGHRRRNVAANNNDPHSGGRARPAVLRGKSIFSQLGIDEVPWAGRPQASGQELMWCVAGFGWGERHQMGVGHGMWGRMTPVTVVARANGSVFDRGAQRLVTCEWYGGGSTAISVPWPGGWQQGWPSSASLPRHRPHYAPCCCYFGGRRCCRRSKEVALVSCSALATQPRSHPCCAKSVSCNLASYQPFTGVYLSR